MNVFIKPNRPYIYLAIASAFLLYSFAPLFGENSNKLELILLSSIMFGFSIFLFLTTDYQFLYLSCSFNDINIKGYLGIRKIKLNAKDIKGYEIHEKLDQVAGTQNVWVLITYDGEKIVFAKAAYNNYDELVNWIETNFELLGHKKMKYSAFIGKSYIYITIISGIIYFLLALIKLMKVLE